MKQGALYQHIADDFISKITKGEWLENDCLPSERTLAVEYNVSRNVIREAIKVLSEKNLVTNIPGKGNYVSRPTQSSIASTLETAIDLSAVTMDEIIDAREFLETGIMEKYLLTLTKKQIKNLEKIYEDMECSRHNYQLFSKYDTNFHMYLIGCSNNRILQLFMSTLYNMTRKNIIVDSPDPEAVIAESQIDHKEIIESIKSKDGEKLNDTLLKHIDPLRDFYKSNT